MILRIEGPDYRNELNAAAHTLSWSSCSVHSDGSVDAITGELPDSEDNEDKSLIELQQQQPSHGTHALLLALLPIDILPFFHLDGNYLRSANKLKL